MDELSIRQATMEDKRAILDIHDNVYGGQDYLTSYFDHFMTTPNITSYVAVIADQIVGFVVAHVVDEGATVVTRAARTNTAFSGQGIYSSLTKHLTKMTKAKTVAFTASNQNQVLDSSSFKNVHRKILSRKVICLWVDFQTLDIPPQSLTESDLTTPSTSDIGHMMSSKPHREYMFSNNRIVVQWVPFKLLPSNIPYFSHTGAVTRMVSNTLNDLGEGKGLMSISTLYECKTPKFASILDIYGTDLMRLKDHMLVHFRHIRELTDSEATVLMLVDPSTDVDNVIRIIKDIGIANSSINPECFGQLSTQLVFEKDVIV